MADRYLVGSAWNNNASWSATSGGAGGAGIPSSIDNVYLDLNSPSSMTCLVSSAAFCHNLDFTGYRSTFRTSGASPLKLTIFGSMNANNPNMQWAFAGAIEFVSTGSETVATYQGAAQAYPQSTTFNGDGSWTATSDMRAGTKAVVFKKGTVDMAGYRLVCGPVSASSTSPKSISLGPATHQITLGGWDLSNTAGLTFDAGTSTINQQGNPESFKGGGLTYYDVRLAAGSGQPGPVTAQISGANSFRNLTLNGVNVSYTIADDQSISGTLAAAPTTGSGSRVRIASNSSGVSRTISVTSAVSLADTDFQDIAAGGATAPWSGSNLGDQGGNSGITF